MGMCSNGKQLECSRLEGNQMNGGSTGFRGIIKLKTLCVGGMFGQILVDNVAANEFPHNVLSQENDFEFQIVAQYDQALDIISTKQDIDLVFMDADFDLLSAMTMFITQLQEIRPRLPVVIFSNRVGSTMRHLLRGGASWHYTKYADELGDLAKNIHHQVFSPVRWEEIFTYYARNDVKPRIEPGLSHTDLEALRQNPEEQYIIKRLFANSDVVQIFRMDEGFSGSRIYTVKPRHQLKRILKIGSAEDLEAVQEKQERLIQPRLFRQVGQIRGKVISAQHLGGACYSLAGSNREAVTLAQFLLDQNRVRKELLDLILDQLRDSLSELYTGNSEIELRYWAPLYSQVLPPFITLEDAVLVGSEDSDAEFVLDANTLTALSAVPGNGPLEGVNQAVRKGQKPELALLGFEVAELDSNEGVIYLHDTLTERYPADPALSGKEHPILRFKVYLRPSERGLLTHPVLRRGKQVSVRGRVSDTQETILARNVGLVTRQGYDNEGETFEFAKARFIPLLENIRYLLWEVGREDMIVPMPIVSPVVHGDLNAGNILVEASPEMPLWLIDFSEARPGHIFFDLAKLEVEVRTHVFYRLFLEMVEEHLWDETTAQQFSLLVENLLLQIPEASFEEYVGSLRGYQSEWYDALYAQFPLYFENLLYFIFSLRTIARQISPERFRRHYPVAVFFQSVTALKYEGLNQEPWKPWAKRLALGCALVHGKEAVAQAKRPKDVTNLLSGLRQRSALALVKVGSDEKRKYLMQWNKNWDRFNLVGGRIDNGQGDRDSFARALQRKLVEELGLRCPKDYRITRELPPVVRQQFSRREHVFRDYEFRLYEIELLPRHPRNEEDFMRFAQRLSEDHENVLLSPTEIEHLRTSEGRPISETARTILQEIGEIEMSHRQDLSTMIELELDDTRPKVTRGRVQLCGSLINARFGNLIENTLVEILPRPGYAVEPHSKVIRIGDLDAGQEFPLEIWLQPREEEVKLTLRVTYYDTRGNEYHQILEEVIHFRTPVFSLFHLDNPYVVGKPISSGNDLLYVGRDEVFTWIGGNLLGGDRPHSLILTGQPCMGKTSTLYQLAHGTLGQALREYPEQPLIPVYLNVEDLEAQNTGAFFSWLSESIARNMRNRGVSIAAPVSWPANGQGYHLFDQYLDEVELSLPNDSLLVLILDELEQLRIPIEQGDLDPDFLPYLRSLMQHRSRLSFIVAGTNKLSDDFWQLVFNAGEKMELTLLSRRETERLIREPVQPLVRYDDLAVEHIWRSTSGHPYLTQLICHRLIQAEGQDGRRQRIITMDRVHKMIDQILEEDDSYLIGRWAELSSLQQQVLASLAELQGPSDETVPSSALIPHEGSEEVQQALEHLVHVGLVKRLKEETITSAAVKARNGSFGEEQRSSSYMLAYGLLRRWVVGKQPGSKIKEPVAAP